MITWNPDLLNELVAPQIEKFTEAEIRDLRPLYKEAGYWVGNHFLNSAVRHKFNGRVRKLILTIVRRSESTFYHYHEAANKTKTYLDGNNPLNPRVTKYFQSVNEWEIFCLQFQMVIDTFNKLNALINVEDRAFQDGDESKEYRVYQIANAIKHSAGYYSREDDTAQLSMPLWLSNQGLHSFGHSITYFEAAGITNDVATLAEHYVDPYDFVQKYRKSSGVVEEPDEN